MALLSWSYSTKIYLLRPGMMGTLTLPSNQKGPYVVGGRVQVPQQLHVFVVLAVGESYPYLEG